MNCSLKIFLLLLISLVSLSLLSFQTNNHEVLPKQSANSFDKMLAVDSRKLEGNNIRTWFRTNGSFNRDPATGNSGFEWPKNTSKFARYASGLLIGAVSQSDTLVCVAMYTYEYLPGYVDNNGMPQGRDNPDYRIYNISATDTSDYEAWRNIASVQGAYLDSMGNPFLIGAQTMFYSYTDGYADSHGNNAGGTAPLKAQILQTNWCINNAALRNVIFSEFRVINRSNIAWNNAYISIWTDDDLGGSGDDAVGCDSLTGLAYTYNYASSDPTYGNPPPAVGTTVLRSPLKYTGNMNDTVKYYSPPGSNNKIVKVGYMFTGISSFNTYINGDPTAGDPTNYRETYRNIQGLKRNGTSWINPITSSTTKFPYSGNPVNSSGWIMTSGNDRRSMQSFGPLTVQPGDTQSVIIAQLVASGSTNLQSITSLKTLSAYVKNFFENNLTVSVQNVSLEVPSVYNLAQNYPNPFNPSTTISYSIPEAGNVKLSVFDMMGREVMILVNEFRQAGIYEAILNAERFASGTYFYRLETGNYISAKKMVYLK